MTESTEQTDASQYLREFWGTHATVFMRWFLSLPYKGQLTLLKKACPDLPISYDAQETEPTPCQLLTPELTISNLLGDNGKVLLRLMHARARKREDCARHDLIYVQLLRDDGRMPIFSGNRLKAYKMAFVDPKDPDMRIQAVDNEASDASIEAVKNKFKTGHLIEADVWLTLQMRQHVIITMLTHMTATFESLFSSQNSNFQGLHTGIGCRYCGAELEFSKASPSGISCDCHLAFYCSSEHKAQDYRNHEKTCKVLQKCYEEKQNQ